MTKEERLISALIGLVRAAEGNEDLITAETDRLIIDSLATLHESALDERVFKYLMKEVKREKGRLAPSCQFCAMPCGRTGDYDMSNLLDNSSEIRNAKGRILTLAERLAKEDGKNRDKMKLIYKALYYIGLDDCALLSYSLIIEDLKEALIQGTE